MEPIDRIINLMSEKQVTQAAVGQVCGMTKSTINYIYNHRTDIGSRYIVPIAKLLDVDPMYLLTGEERYENTEKETPLPADESELLSVYEKLDREGKTMVLATAYTHRARVMANSNQTTYEEEPTT